MRNRANFIGRLCLILFCAALLGIFIFRNHPYIKGTINIVKDGGRRVFQKGITIPDMYSEEDNNNNGVKDPIDIVNAAREEVENETVYVSNYYTGGYPPSSEGVCTDVIWRGFLQMGVNLKDLMDEDIAENTHSYPRVNGSPDPNIDFRRVLNQKVFFDKYAESLTTELIPWDEENLIEWQPGDIVLFLTPTEHVGIVSDKRDKDGVPYFIHNSPPHAKEVKLSHILSYYTPAGHYRWRY